MEKDAFVLGLLKGTAKLVGKAGSKAGISPASAGITGLMAAPVGIGAAAGAMPSGGLKRSILGSNYRKSLTDVVKSPQGSMF